MIQYRVWDKNSGIMFGEYSDWEDCFIEADGSIYSCREFGYERVRVKTHLYSGITMLWTGYFDKNEKKIYDGDLVEVEYKKYRKRYKFITKIIWKNGWILSENRTPLIDHAVLIAARKYIEIIGNIHQNPELL